MVRCCRILVFKIFKFFLQLLLALILSKLFSCLGDSMRAFFLVSPASIPFYSWIMSFGENLYANCHSLVS